MSPVFCLTWSLPAFQVLKLWKAALIATDKSSFFSCLLINILSCWLLAGKTFLGHFHDIFLLWAVTASKVEHSTSKSYWMKCLHIFFIYLFVLFAGCWNVYFTVHTAYFDIWKQTHKSKLNTPHLLMPPPLVYTFFPCSVCFLVVG